MLRFAADENFNNYVIRGLARRLGSVDLVRVQDVGLRGADDESVLDWTAENDRILLTHDVRTVTHWAISFESKKGWQCLGCLSPHDHWPSDK